MLPAPRTALRYSRSAAAATCSAAKAQRAELCEDSARVRSCREAGQWQGDWTFILFGGTEPRAASTELHPLRECLLTRPQTGHHASIDRSSRPDAQAPAPAGHHASIDRSSRPDAQAPARARQARRSIRYASVVHRGSGPRTMR